jgi:hypothetical protein
VLQGVQRWKLLLGEQAVLVAMFVMPGWLATAALQLSMTDDVMHVSCGLYGGMTAA